jgi:hypothetical protein
VSRRGCWRLGAPVAQDAAEGILAESAAGMESAVVVPPLTLAGKGMGVSLPQPTEAVMAAPTVLVVGMAEGVLGGAGPSSPRLAIAAAKEVLVPSLPAAAPQECDAAEGATRAASPEIREAEESSGAALSRGIGDGEAHVLELACAPWAAAF